MNIVFHLSYFSPLVRLHFFFCIDCIGGSMTVGGVLNRIVLSYQLPINKYLYTILLNETKANFHIGYRFASFTHVKRAREDTLFSRSAYFFFFGLFLLLFCAFCCCCCCSVALAVKLCRPPNTIFCCCCWCFTFNNDYLE